MPTQIISPTWIVPVVPRGTVLEGHSVVVRDDRILDILPTAEARASAPDADEITLPEHVLTPGFVNTHGHAAMTLLRGYADDRELMDWLNNHIWPVEGKLVNADFVYDGTSLAVAEMIAGGTTCGADSYFFPEATARAFADFGFRGQVTLPVIQFPNAWASTEAEHMEKGLALHDSLRDSALIHTAFAPHSPYTVTDDGFEKIVAHSESHDIAIHLHLHETATEVDDAMAAENRRPFARMQSLGVVSNRLQAVHMTQMTAGEIATMAEVGAHVAHCPESNMKLASGTCPVPALLDAGVNVAIGTDGAASNNNLDMIEEARSASLLAKVATGDATSLSAETLLEMMTLGGARFLGLESKIGTIEKGKAADLTATDLSPLRSQPVHNPVSQLVYTASATQVTHTWIAGRLLYRDGTFKETDIERVHATTRQWRDTISSL